MKNNPVDKLRIFIENSCLCKIKQSVKLTMRKSAYIKIFCASAAVVVLLAAGLFAAGYYCHGLVMVILLSLASCGLQKVVK